MSSSPWGAKHRLGKRNRSSQEALSLLVVTSEIISVSFRAARDLEALGILLRTLLEKRPGFKGLTDSEEKFVDVSVVSSSGIGVEGE